VSNEIFKEESSCRSIETPTTVRRFWEAFKTVTLRFTRGLRFALATVLSIAQIPLSHESGNIIPNAIKLQL